MTMILSSFQYNDTQYNVFSPVISESTMKFHFDKHYQGYINKYNQLIQNTEFASESLHDSLKQISEEIRQQSFKNLAIFNNGGQVWNHYFYWASLRNISTADESFNATSSTMHADITNLITVDNAFTDLNHFRQSFLDVGMKHFGSGWLWIVLVEANGVKALDFICTKNADSPLFYTEDAYSIHHAIHIANCHPVLVCDLWEHAYYLDYQNNRLEYLHNFYDKLINWDFVKRNIDNVAKMTQSFMHYLDEVNLIGMSTTINFSDSEDVVVKAIQDTVSQYQQFMSKHAKSGPISDLYSVYAEYTDTGYTYFCGHVSDHDTEIEGLRSLHIPKQKYTKFHIGPGNIGEYCSHAWKTIWQMSLQEFNGERAFVADFEVYKNMSGFDMENAVFDIYVGLQ